MRSAVSAERVLSHSPWHSWDTPAGESGKLDMVQTGMVQTSPFEADIKVASAYRQSGSRAIVKAVERNASDRQQAIRSPSCPNIWPE